MKKRQQSGKVAQVGGASPRDMSHVEGFDEAMKKIVGVPKAEIERREQAERDAKRASR